MVLLGLAVILFAGMSVYLARFDSLLLKWALLGNIFLWILLPGIGALVFHAFIGPESGAGFGLIYLCETAFVAIALLLFLLQRKKIANAKSFVVSTKLFLFFSIVLIYHIYSVSGVGYLESNDISGGLESGLGAFLTSLVFAYIVHVALFSVEKFKYLCALFLLSVFSLTVALSGGRMSLLLPLFIIFYRLAGNSKVKYSRKFLGCLSIILPLTILLSWLSLSVEGNRAEKSGISVIQLGTDYDGVSILRSAFQKFNSYDSGASLINGYGAGSAGFEPYKGALLYPIPRAIFSEKPVPGSVTNDRSGTPSRLVPSLINPLDTINNVGVSPFAVSVWHWGWLWGSIIFTFSVFLNLKLFQYCFSHNYLFFQILGISMVPVPGFINLIPSPDIFVKNLVTVGVFSTLFFLVKSATARNQSLNMERTLKTVKPVCKI